MLLRHHAKQQNPYPRNMQMSYRPRLIKKASTIKHGKGQKVDIVELVCSNCGMRKTDSEFWPAKNHFEEVRRIQSPLRLDRDLRRARGSRLPRQHEHVELHPVLQRTWHLVFHWSP